MEAIQKCTTKPIATNDTSLSFSNLSVVSDRMPCSNGSPSVAHHTYVENQFSWCDWFLLFEIINSLSVNVLSFRSVFVSALHCTMYSFAYFIIRCCDKHIFVRFPISINNLRKKKPEIGKKSVCVKRSHVQHISVTNMSFYFYTLEI